MWPFLGMWIYEKLGVYRACGNWINEDMKLYELLFNCIVFTQFFSTKICEYDYIS